MRALLHSGLYQSPVQSSQETAAIKPPGASAPRVVRPTQADPQACSLVNTVELLLWEESSQLCRQQLTACQVPGSERRARIRFQRGVSEVERWARVLGRTYVRRKHKAPLRLWGLPRGLRHASTGRNRMRARLITPLRQLRPPHVPAHLPKGFSTMSRTQLRGSLTPLMSLQDPLRPSHTWTKGGTCATNGEYINTFGL
jgi:hypothetical protein